VTGMESAVPISSALLQVTPKNIIVLPVLFESQVKAVIDFLPCRNSPTWKSPFSSN